MFSLFLLAIVTFLVWKWFSNDTRVIVKGTIDRTGKDTLLVANKGLDNLEESFDISPAYEAELLKRYSGKPSTKK